MMPEYRSVSQVNEYRRCAYAYYLGRVARVWKRPAAWLPQGTAVHTAAEEYEKSGRTLTLDEAQDAFRDDYAREVTKYADTTPNLEYWYSSGPYKGPVDVERRYGIGLDQVAKYLDYYERQAPDEVIWVAEDGTPAIELTLNTEMGGVAFRGYLDQVVVKDGRPIVRDVKTGNKPGDAFQLKTYAIAMERQYGLTAGLGDYWMGRTGKPTKTFDLDLLDTAEVEKAFQEVDAGIRAERFEPDPDPDKCRFCSVRSSCDFAV